VSNRSVAAATPPARIATTLLFYSVGKRYRGSRSGISATAYAITEIAAAARETSSGGRRSIVSAAV
jgi:hypothetical protein